MIRYTLPLPPTVNNLFFNAKNGGRAVTAKYAAWRKHAGQCILEQGRDRIRGQVSLSIAVVRPDKRRRDLSNLIKPVEDLLVAMQVIDDDSFVQRISVNWVDQSASFECAVLVMPFEGGVAS